MSETIPDAAPHFATAWSDAELNCAVRAYLKMLNEELAGRDYNKATVNRALREGPLAGRTKASVEFRMQNISAALFELKLPRIAGYLPAKNIGSTVKDRIISVLHQNGIDSLLAFVPTSDRDALAKKVIDLRKRGLGKVPSGAETLMLVTVSSVAFVRDPAVKAWVLQNALGVCEGCDQPAPFLGQDGLPYLEVHHVMRLASYGSDRVTNAAALCPNCHRRCHFAADRDEFKLELYRKIHRLVLEVPEAANPQTDELVQMG
jgi:5-methylcytosine-specific restriction protein A